MGKFEKDKQIDYSKLLRKIREKPLQFAQPETNLNSSFDQEAFDLLNAFDSCEHQKTINMSKDQVNLESPRRIKYIQDQSSALITSNQKERKLNYRIKKQQIIKRIVMPKKTGSNFPASPLLEKFSIPTQSNSIMLI